MKESSLLSKCCIHHYLYIPVCVPVSVEDDDDSVLSLFLIRYFEGEYITSLSSV